MPNGNRHRTDRCFNAIAAITVPGIAAGFGANIPLPGTMGVSKEHGIVYNDHGTIYLIDQAWQPWLLAANVVWFTCFGLAALSGIYFAYNQTAHKELRSIEQMNLADNKGMQIVLFVSFNLFWIACLAVYLSRDAMGFRPLVE